MAKQKRRIKC